MAESSTKRTSFYMERNKLVGSSNLLAWKKRTELILIENEIIGHVKGSIIKPPQEEDKAMSKYMKWEIRAQIILIESFKDSLTTYVAKFENSKEIYDKLVELFFLSTTGEAISLRTDYST